MQFADLTAPPTTNEIDPNLKDATGYNADLGYRGRIKSYLYFDVSLFSCSIITGSALFPNSVQMAVFIISLPT